MGLAKTTTTPRCIMWARAGRSRTPSHPHPPFSITQPRSGVPQLLLLLLLLVLLPVLPRRAHLVGPALAGELGVCRVVRKVQPCSGSGGGGSGTKAGRVRCAGGGHGAAVLVMGLRWVGVGVGRGQGQGQGE